MGKEDTDVLPDELGSEILEREYSSEKFLDVLSLPKFRKALSISARHTSKTGLETAFTVEILSDDSFWIDKVEEGGTDRMEFSQTLIEIDGQPHLKVRNISISIFTQILEK